MRLPIIEEDKANHLIYGIVIFIIAFAVTNEYIALLTVTFAGAFKEYLDHLDRENHTPCIYDFIYTVVGGFLGFILVLIVHLKDYLPNLLNLLSNIL